MAWILDPYDDLIPSPVAYEQMVCNGEKFIIETKAQTIAIKVSESRNSERKINLAASIAVLFLLNYCYSIKTYVFRGNSEK